MEAAHQDGPDTTEVELTVWRNSITKRPGLRLEHLAGVMMQNLLRLLAMEKVTSRKDISDIQVYLYKKFLEGICFSRIYKHIDYDAPENTHLESVNCIINSTYI